MMVVTALFLFAYFAFKAAGQYTTPPFANTSGPVGPAIELGYIKVQGTRAAFGNFSAKAWLGIRYAQDPTGDLRLAPPVPIEGSHGNYSRLFNATTYGPICYQAAASAYQGETAAATAAAYGIGNRHPSEDCLLLDVYAPDNPVSESLPVLFYIHGGGYIQGCSTMGIQPGDIFASLPGQVIVVSVQYRLAGFGFLGGDRIAHNGALNAGLQDQRLALEWVRRHISSFGGDPNRLILDGGSAGGGSVLFQLMWKGGEQNPPYKAAMAEFPAIPTVLNSSQLEIQYHQVLSAANCSDIQCLRSLSGAQFDAAQQTVLTQDASSYSYGLFYYAPYADGTFIQNMPSVELSLGHLAPVVLMTSREGNEGLIFTPANITTTADWEAEVHSLFNGGVNFSVSSGAVCIQWTPPTCRMVIGDAFIACVSQFAASAATNVLSQIQNNQDPPVWKFIYAYPTYATAYHGSYYPHIYTGHRYSPSDNSTVAQIGRALTQYYTSFILHYDTNAGVNGTGSSASPWPRYGTDSNVVFFGSDGGLSNITDLDIGPRCQFLQAHPTNYQV
ncbi:hypothetical protein LTR49_026525 [Elasticomyces elasticus]|nr:hypothetical protein LTR49_026525 [Elasticomyces elasticus]